MKIQQVPVEYVNQIWPYVEQYLYNALQYAQGDYTIDDIRVFLTQGLWSLVVAVDDSEQVKGAAAITYFNRPSDRVAFVTAIGGRLIANEENWTQFQNILRANGATYIEGAGRPAIIRLWSRYGLEPKYTIIGKSL